MKINDSLPFTVVRDHRPLQQGLRPVGILKSFIILNVRDHRPLQQGLRLTVFCSFRSDIFFVRDHRPLQQGLRHTLR